MTALDNEKSGIGDIALAAQATIAALVLVLSVTLCAFGGLLASGLVHIS